MRGALLSRAFPLGQVVSFSLLRLYLCLLRLQREDRYQDTSRFNLSVVCFQPLESSRFIVASSPSVISQVPKQSASLPDLSVRRKIVSVKLSLSLFSRWRAL